MPLVPIRNKQQLINDCLWPPRHPEMAYGYEVPKGRGQRLKAIKKVLRAVPPDDYELLKERRHKITWMMPIQEDFGYASEVVAGDLIYLASRIEFEALPFAVYVVAHELAHVLLGHKWHGDKSAKERAVDARLCTWGLVSEVAAWNAYLREFGETA